MDRNQFEMFKSSMLSDSPGVGQHYSKLPRLPTLTLSSNKKYTKRFNKVDTDEYYTNSWSPISKASAKIELDSSECTELGRNITTITKLKDRSGDMTSDYTDDETMAKCITKMNSNSSSISWAEDAVELELTKKVFLLWESIQLVCTNVIRVRPTNMTSQVFQECLNWNRAFPNQNISRFSRYADFKNQSHSPAKSRELSPKDRNFSPPTKYLLERHIPDKEKKDSYVAVWLAGCSLAQAENEDREQFLGDDDTLSTSTSKSRSSAVYDIFNEYSSDYLQNNLRVQKPISIRSVGHHITPRPTEFSSRTQDRVFRKTNEPSRNQDFYSYSSSTSYGSSEKMRSIDQSKKMPDLTVSKSTTNYYKSNNTTSNTFSRDNFSHSSSCTSATSTNFVHTLTRNGRLPVNNSKTTTRTNVPRDGIHSFTNFPPGWSRHSSSSGSYENPMQTSLAKDRYLGFKQDDQNFQNFGQNYKLSSSKEVSTMFPYISDVNKPIKQPRSPLFLCWLMDNMSPD